MSQNRVSKIILTAVEDGLASLGATPKQAIIFHLENTFDIRKEQIPENLTEFAKALEKIFGPGASYLERLIVKSLYEKLGLETENLENLDFLNSVESIKRRLLSEGGQSKIGEKL